MATATAAHAVEVRSLSKQYRGRGPQGKPVEVRAVDDVSLSVRSGELVVLLGPSGCGKTTLLRSVAGLDRPQAGEIRINGQTVFSAASGLFVPPEERRIGMMFQSYALWPHMTAAQNVGYPISGLKAAAVAERVAALLDRLGVAGLGHRYPGELSGGQQQRVALARALVASPTVILFDEPLSNVDAKVRRRLRAELRELKARTGFGGIYVTHDQEEAMELADTLVVMDGGRIRQVDTPRRVYEHPASMYVAEFVGEINHWPATMTAGAVGGSGLTVDTALGRIDVPTGAQAARDGDAGWVGIRPEHVVLVSRAPDAMRGVVRDAIYLGARVECRIDVQGTMLIAWVSADRASELRLAEGTEVGVLIPAEHLRWLPR